MTFIHPSAVIYPNVTIEEDCYIGEFCVIGSPAEWKGKEDKGLGVIISRGTRITKLVTIDSGVDEVTFIGENCYIMAHAHVGHDAYISDNVTLSCGVKIGGHAIIGRFTNIGLNAVIHQKVVVPNRCMIGASAFVGKTLLMKGNCKYAGVPAKYLSSNERISL